jgi:hypothetical protein
MNMAIANRYLTDFSYSNFSRFLEDSKCCDITGKIEVTKTLGMNKRTKMSLYAAL